MATINTFKEMRSWQQAKELSVECYKLTKENQYRSEFAMVSQMRRCAISVPSNIAEGFERKGNKEFIQFLFIAAGSLAELQTQLIISSEVGLLEPTRLARLENKCEAIKKMIYGMITYLKSSEQKGYKFSEPDYEYRRTRKLNETEAHVIGEEFQSEGALVWEQYKRNRGDVYDAEVLELSNEFVQR